MASESTSVTAPDIALTSGVHRGEVVRRSYYRLAALFLFTEIKMIADRYDHLRIFQSSKPEWAQVWHLWMVIVPRRSITGRLVFGKVWRRYDGCCWIYKKFVEYANDE